MDDAVHNLRQKKKKMPWFLLRDLIIQEADLKIHLISSKVDDIKKWFFFRCYSFLCCGYTFFKIRVLIFERHIPKYSQIK